MSEMYSLEVSPGGWGKFDWSQDSYSVRCETCRYTATTRLVGAAECFYFCTDHIPRIRKWPDGLYELLEQPVLFNCSGDAARTPEMAPDE